VVLRCSDAPLYQKLGLYTSLLRSHGVPNYPSKTLVRSGLHIYKNKLKDEYY